LPSQGKLYVVGIGPGNVDHLTIRAKKIIEDSEVVIGHSTYVKRVQELVQGKEVIMSGMGKEVDRVKKAIAMAREKKVVLLSGGDPGVYGMLPLVAEIMAKNDSPVEWEAIPGVTAFSAANSILGSPISGDCAIVSLSDLLVSWREIENRLISALKGDFVIAIYNPSSKTRKPNLIKAIELISEYRPGYPAGIVKNAFREGEQFTICKVSELKKYLDEIDMSTILIIGNSKSFIKNNMIVTPRGYGRKYDC
jgi:precorrin-3B C17-methyltransferase